MTDEFISMTDQQLIDRAIEIQQQVDTSKEEYLAILVDKNPDMKRMIATLIILFGDDSVIDGGEPKLFPGTHRILIYK